MHNPKLSRCPDLSFADCHAVLASLRVAARHWDDRDVREAGYDASVALRELTDDWSETLGELGR